jgi:putative photosynthetic complex assembly protein
MRIDVEDEMPRIGVPKGALIGAGLLIAATIALAAVTRFTGRTSDIVKETAGSSVSREILIRAGVTEAEPITILDAASGQPVITFAAGEGGFVRGSLRALRYEREKRGLTLEGSPYRLVGWRNGRLTLEDPASGYHVELNAFGPTNVAAFARLLE